ARVNPAAPRKGSTPRKYPRPTPPNAAWASPPERDTRRLTITNEPIMPQTVLAISPAATAFLKNSNPRIESIIPPAHDHGIPGEGSHGRSGQRGSDTLR